MKLGWYVDHISPSNRLHNWFSRGIIRKLPTPLSMGVMLLNRRDREDVLADLQDWYQEIADTRWAKFFVLMKLLSAIGGNMLSIAERVAGIIGKARGQKKTE